MANHSDGDMCDDQAKSSNESKERRWPYRAERTSKPDRRLFAAAVGLVLHAHGAEIGTQSQLHFGVLSAGQVILQVSLMPIPHDTISQELELPATMGGSLTMTGVAALAPMKS